MNLGAPGARRDRGGAHGRGDGWRRRHLRLGHAQLLGPVGPGAPCRGRTGRRDRLAGRLQLPVCLEFGVGERAGLATIGRPLNDAPVGKEPRGGQKRRPQTSRTSTRSPPLRKRNSSRDRRKPQHEQPLPMLSVCVGSILRKTGRSCLSRRYFPVSESDGGPCGRSHHPHDYPSPLRHRQPGGREAAVRCVRHEGPPCAEAGFARSKRSKLSQTLAIVY